MEGNKDEALRCLKIAEEMISSGNKHRALKFLGIARRLNRDLPLDHLLAACDNLGDPAAGPASFDNPNGSDSIRRGDSDGVRVSNGRNYSKEQAELVRGIKRNSKDYYAILGVERSCSVEEVRKAYKKLSLKVHPDKNKAPGAEDAFKVVSKAFKCLNDGDSRREYDRVGGAGFAGGLGRKEYGGARANRRRSNVNSFYYDDGDDFDPNEVFRSVFGQGGVFGTQNVYRGRDYGQHRGDFRGGGGGGGGPSLILLLQILPFLFILLLAYLPFWEPDYSLHKNQTYQVPMVTERYGVEFFVKSSSFDDTHPLGSPAREKVEDTIVKDYKNMLWRYCHVELQRRSWSKNYPTPHCNKLHDLGLA